jgi:hypothetical protein
MPLPSIVMSVMSSSRKYSGPRSNTPAWNETVPPPAPLRSLTADSTTIFRAPVYVLVWDCAT